MDKDGVCRLSGNGHATSRFGHLLPEGYDAELRGAKTQSNSYIMHGDAYVDTDVGIGRIDSFLAFGSEADLGQTIGTGIHNARGGGGRGAYKHIDGDFHGLHRNGKQLERAVSTPADKFERAVTTLAEQIGRAVGTLAEQTMRAGGTPVDQIGRAVGTPAEQIGRAVGKFVAITWNACGMEAGAISDAVDLLENRHWDAILVQEGPFIERSGCRTIAGGHVLFGSSSTGSKRSVCVLLHRRWALCKSCFRPISSRLAYLDIDILEWKLKLTVAHLPDSGLDDVYEAALLALEEIIAKGRVERRTNIVGVDANAVIGKRTAADCAQIIGEHGHGYRNERGQLFTAWLHGQKVAALNTMAEKPEEELWTHELWSTKARRQIDFVLIDEIRGSILRDAGVLDCLLGKSDHRAVFADMEIPSDDAPRQQNKKKRIRVGWSPIADDRGKPTAYHEALDQTLASIMESSQDPTQAVVDAAEKCSAPSSSPKRRHSEEVMKLFEERRSETDPVLRKQLSKDLWKALRRQRRKLQQDELDTLAKDGGGLKRLRRAQQKWAGHERTTGMRDEFGVFQTDPDDMCQIFAKFYEDLYKECAEDQVTADDTSDKSFDVEVTVSEVVAALRRLGKRKTGADDGLVAEMLQTDHAGLHDVLAKFFTELLRNQLQYPEAWKVAKLSVIFKSGLADNPKNYRPITIIPVMAKLFSSILYSRIQQQIEKLLDEEQYGFRKGRGCSDAVHIVRVVAEKSAEWGEELWISALDVEKAFDRVHHSCLFEALLDGGIDAAVVASLRRLYLDMRAYVVPWPGAKSQEFRIERGVRQGDPLSPLLFNLVLNQVLGEVTPIWKRRGYGTNVGMSISGERLTHVMFADDMTLIARSSTSMRRMLKMLRDALLRRGLSLHPAKCKLQNNLPGQERMQLVIDDSFSVEVVPAEEGFKLLGTMLHLDDLSKREIVNRIASGWRMFWSMKRLLLNKRVSINQRLKLLDSTVSSCVLWCSESWTPRAEESRALKVAQNGMLRRIVGRPRGLDEEWLDWIRTSTRRARSWAEKVGIKDWGLAHSRNKWRWAGHVARRGGTSWLARVTTWRDSQWQSVATELGTARPLRPSTRRYMKWEDVLRRYCTSEGLGQWTILAEDREAWSQHADTFAQRMRPM
jgi:hypothetical protein